MKREQITPLILTYNEEENISRVLDKLTWANQVIVLDSKSEDNTRKLAEKYANVCFHVREFDSMAEQWNYGMSLVSTTWVLSLDADYIVSENVLAEIDHLPEIGCAGYAIPFKYCIAGKPIFGSLLPPRVCLFQKELCSYFNDGHTQRLKCNGPVGKLAQPLMHDDRKSLTRWLNNQKSYIALEAEKLFHASPEDLSLPDKIRKFTPFAPFLVFLYALFLKGAVLSGWRGVYYAYQRLFVEGLLAIHLLELKYRAKKEPYQSPST